jgi:glycosyltransferase involved in cell wall biosynthesis
MVGKIQDLNYSYFEKNNTLPVNLHYLGAKTINEVNGLLKNSICLIHTCKPEGFGNNFIQAWLQAKPTISLEFDPGDLIRNYNLGFVSDNSIEKFIEDIKIIIKDESLRKYKGDNAKRYADQHHHPEKNAQKLAKFIEIIINN